MDQELERHLRRIAGDIRALAQACPEKTAELIALGDKLDREVDRMRDPHPREDPAGEKG